MSSRFQHGDRIPAFAALRSLAPQDVLNAFPQALPFCLPATGPVAQDRLTVSPLTLPNLFPSENNDLLWIFFYFEVLSLITQDGREEL